MPQAITQDKAYYEVAFAQLGPCPQVGWVTPSFTRIEGHSSDGVGDDDHGWGVDGQRKKKMHGGDEPWATEWAHGDVIGVAVDVPEGKLFFSRNGKWQAVFTDVDLKDGVYPAISAKHAICRVNFGASPFRFAAPDWTFQPIAPAKGVCDMEMLRGRANDVHLPTGSPRDSGAAAAMHAGRWREAGVTVHTSRCSRPGEEDGPLCTHPGGVIPKDHWSCCGAPLKDMPCGATTREDMWRTVAQQTFRAIFWNAAVGVLKVLPDDWGQPYDFDHVKSIASDGGGAAGDAASPPPPPPQAQPPLGKPAA
eukprot:gene8223-5247_t